VHVGTDQVAKGGPTRSRAAVERNPSRERAIAHDTVIPTPDSSCPPADAVSAAERQPFALAAGRPRRNRSRRSPAAQPSGARIDRPLELSYAGRMNLQVPPELEAKLIRLATETGRSVDQVALDLLASSIDHDEWFRSEVEKGRASAREGRLLEHDDVAARMDRRYRG
jgi:predicted transcriptional regulator